MFNQQKYRRAEPVISELKLEYQNCTRWAVIVGISEYEHKEWNLKYAHRDADEFYDLLLTPNGGKFKKEHIRKLTNKEAKTVDIKKAISSFLRQPAKDDLVLLYFACHGASDPYNNRDLYLLTYDTEPDDIRATALPMEAITRSIERFEKVIILADTCHSGGLISNGKRSPMDDSQLMNKYLADLSRAKAIATITSAEKQEVAREDKKWGGGHGVFTYYLLKGMRGEADKDKNGIVTIGELFEYVRDEVKRATNDEQHPSIGGDFDRYLPIAITPYEIYFEEALELYRKGELDQAISKMNQAVRLNPNPENRGWYNLRLGDMLYKLGKIDQAIKAYQEGFRLGAGDAPVYSHVGFIFYNLDKFDKAISFCEKAISLDSKFSEAYITLGAVFQEQGSLEKAVSNYKQAIDIDTNSFEAHLRLGMVLFEQKKLNEALKAFEKAKQIDPNQPVVWLQLGIVLYEQDDNLPAVKYLNNAIFLFKEDGQTEQADKLQSFVSQIEAETTRR